MRFAVGHPKQLTCPSGSPIGFAAANKNFFVTISEGSLLLWSAKPQIVIAKVIRNQQAVLEEGPYVGVLWKSDHSAIAVWTQKGVLFIFGIFPSQISEKVLEYQFKKEFYYMSGPNESRGIAPMEVTLQVMVSTASEISCGLCFRNKILFMTKSGKMEIRSWDGILSNSVVLREIPFLEAEKTQDFFISSVSVLDSAHFAWVLSTGKVYFVSHLEDENLWKGFECEGPGKNLPKASCTAFSAKSGILAVGLEDGSVINYSLNENKTGLSISNTFSLQNSNSLNLEFKTVGKVACMEWTSDGLNLALGWQNSGFSVWNVFGNLTTCSLIPIAELEFEQEAIDLGLISLAWGIEGYELFLLQRTSLAAQNMLSVQEFLRPSSSLGHIQSNIKLPILVGESSLQLYVGQMISSETVSEVQHWRPIELPTHYLSDNWPISHLAISLDGKLVAIAGQRGFGHYNLATNKWKLFNNVQHEREFRCRGGMCWIRDVLVIACQDVNHLRHEIKFYWQNSRLDKQSVLHNMELRFSVIHLTSHGNNLLVYTSDNIVREYEVELNLESQDPFSIGEKEKIEKVVKMKLLRETNLNHIVAHPSNVRAIAWFLGSSFFELPIETVPLLVLDSKKLNLIQRNELTKGSKLLGPKVDINFG